jgi:hypothetical protein
MANSEHKLTNETKTIAATGKYSFAGASAVEKRASFDSGYHSNYAGGEGECTTGETGKIVQATYYPPNGPGQFETPQSCAELFDERFRLMMGEAEGVMGVRGSNANTSNSNSNSNGNYTYTGNSGKS